MKKAALYVRVSTEEQKLHGMSVDSQIAALKEYCAVNGYQIYDIYNDAGISGRKNYTKRPELLRMLDDCSKFDYIFFTKLDRWFRSVGDYYEVQRVLDKHKVNWRAIWEDYDTGTSSGMFSINIMLSIAQAESDRTGDRIKAVNSYRRQNGEWISGFAPTGYKVVKSALVIDESAREAVRAGFEAYMETFNVTVMHDTMVAHGLYIGRQTCFRMLVNPVYAGFSHNHHCEPYLTQEEFDFIQSKRQAGYKIRKPRNKKVYLFQGLIHCTECGSMYRSQTRTMYTRAKVERKRNYYYYYQCGRAKDHMCVNKTTIGENVIERQLLSIIESEMDRYNSTVSNVTAADEEINIEELKARYERQIRRIGDRYEMEEISRDEYREKVADLRAKIDALVPAQKKELEKLPEGWRELYDSLDPSHKKSFWLSAVRSINISADRTITIDF